MNPDIDRTAEINARLNATTVAVSRAAAFAHLGSGLAEEVVDVVERMHGSISRLPAPLGRLADDLTTGITGIIYRGIRRSFGLVTGSIGGLARGLDKMAPEDEGPAWITARGIVNGVFGDALEELNNPLAQTMSLVDRQGDAGSDTLVLFLHGLCMSEIGWDRGDFPEFEAWCRTELGAKTAHLRYNSGRHISINGRELSGLLEATVKNEGIKRLVLIGHSMGGLLTRSACHYGEELEWVERLSHVAMLGTPHRGAPLERLGNFANGLLKHSPYTRPLSHLGDLRSAGIKDLRFSNLVDEDWMDRPDDESAAGDKLDPALLEKVSYLFIAATRSEELSKPVWRNKDDLLVPVASAWGMTREGEDCLPHLKLRREIIANLDHMALMGNREALRHIRGWLS